MNLSSDAAMDDGSQKEFQFLYCDEIIESDSGSEPDTSLEQREEMESFTNEEKFVGTVDGDGIEAPIQIATTSEETIEELTTVDMEDVEVATANYVQEDKQELQMATVEEIKIEVARVVVQEVIPPLEMPDVRSKRGSG